MTKKSPGYYRFRCDSRYMPWEHRFPRILARILHPDPDVIFLQEIDHYKQFRRALAKHGYQGAYQQKRGGAIDGVALFWRTTLQAVGPPVTIPLRVSVHQALAQTLVLDGQPTICCVVHLKAGMNEKDEATRAQQLHTLLETLRDMRAGGGADADAGAAGVIVGGDFNAHHSDLAEPLVVARAVRLLAREGYRNAYAARDAKGGFSTWAGWCAREVKATIDAIWHSPSLRCEAVLDYPPEEDLVTVPERLPNQHEPSDHIHIAAVLRSDKITEA